MSDYGGTQFSGRALRYTRQLAKQVEEICDHFTLSSGSLANKEIAEMASKLRWAINEHADNVEKDAVEDE